ncbi:MAG: acylneuraminate cytidylyltransferase [Sphingobium sp.]
MSSIAIIPARGGSKGLPGKNIIDFHGKPLIHWTVWAALESGCFDQVIVSTDSEHIAEAAVKSGATFPGLRPSHLATDDASTIDVIAHVLEDHPAETVAVLQPTSPLRTSQDITGCIDLFKQIGGRPVVSVSPAKPWLLKREETTCTPVFDFATRRQDTEFFAPNGAVYIFSRQYLASGRVWWNDAALYVMPTERSIDIDTHADLIIAKALFQKFTYDDES